MKRTTRYLASLLFALLPLAAVGQTISLEPNTDRMGGDYKGFALDQADPAICRQACAGDATCQAYTYVQPGLKGPRAMCFLKSSVPPSTPSPCCVSGARLPAGRRAPAPAGVAAPAVTATARTPTLSVPLRAKPADTEAMQFIPAPSTATASSDLGEHQVAWTWQAKGCFPGAAGAEPKPCPYVQDIEGFKVYAVEGSLLKTLQGAGTHYAVVGKQASKCYVVTAYKGALESAPSPIACVDAVAAPLYQMSSSIPTPGNLRFTADPAVCAAATGGGLMGMICDAAMKSNAQILLWDYADAAVDGFRLYDAVKGTPFAVDSKDNPKLRMFAVQPTPIALSDWCFTVRAYKGALESPSSNPVCLTPKGPAKYAPLPKIIVAPASGISTFGVQRVKNQNSGCPFAERYFEARSKSEQDGALSIFWMHRDKNILCGDRSLMWTEGSVLFSMGDIPSNAVTVELRFTTGRTIAFQGTEGGFMGTFGNKPSFNVNCIQSIRAYHITLADNAWSADRYGDPSAYFSWVAEDVIATQTAANTTYRFDVTSLVKKSQAAGKKSLGFVWQVDKSMVGDNDMCMASFQDIALEVKPAP